MAKPSRGTEILVFGPFCDVIWRDSRKKVLRYSELERKPDRLSLWRHGDVTGEEARHRDEQ